MKSLKAYLHFKSRTDIERFSSISIQLICTYICPILISGYLLIFHWDSKDSLLFIDNFSNIYIYLVHTVYSIVTFNPSNIFDRTFFKLYRIQGKIYMQNYVERFASIQLWDILQNFDSRFYPSIQFERILCFMLY